MVEPEADENRYCFFMTPLGAEDSDTRRRADEIEGIISRVVAARNLAVSRADRIGEPGMITDQIVKAIVRSPMVFADLTGGNANVYYELGVAHSLNRPVVTLVDRARSLAFDTAHDRAIVIGGEGPLTYAQACRVEEELERFVDAVTEGRYRPHNVVAEAASIAAVDELAGDDPVFALVSKTHEEIASIRRVLDDLGRTQTGPSTSDLDLMRRFISSFVAEYGVAPGLIRNALLDGRTSAEHDEWVEALLADYDLRADE